MEALISRNGTVTTAEMMVVYKYGLQRSVV